MDLRIVRNSAVCHDLRRGIGNRRLLERTPDEMKIEQLMTKSPRTCRPDSPLSYAARLMWENDIGCLPVTDGDESGHLVGIITDRDICMAAWLSARSLNEVPVATAMTNDVRACNPGDDLAEAEAIMREMAVRRLPVIDALERLIGILSLADLAREALQERGSMNRQVTVGEVGVVLGTLCQPNRIAKIADAYESELSPESSPEEGGSTHQAGTHHAVPRSVV